MTDAEPYACDEHGEEFESQADLDRHEAELHGSCDCESYEPCDGECCGPGMCTCSRPELFG